MGRTKRTFSVATKTKIVLEAIRGEKQINELAAEYELAPNLIRNWKREFLDNASIVFDDKREDNLKDKLKDSRQTSDELAKKVGQLAVQVDWFKKNLRKLLDLTGKVNLVQSLSTSKELPVSTGALLLGVNRTSVYYTPLPISDKELEAKAIIDRLHTEFPTWGSRQLSKQLKLQGHYIGRRLTSRYMTEMAIDPIYPKPSLSTPNKEHKVYPYLLRNAQITAPNKACSIDITYIKLEHGFVYLTAIID